MFSFPSSEQHPLGQMESEMEEYVNLGTREQLEAENEVEGYYKKNTHNNMSNDYTTYLPFIEP